MDKEEEEYEFIGGAIGAFLLFLIVATKLMHYFGI
jgi:hypothetical protein